MLKKETFVNALKTIRRQEELGKKLNEAYCELNPGFYGVSVDGLILMPLIAILEECMDDIGQAISWWLFEDIEKVITWKENGKEISADVTTPEALYDYLIDEAENRKENDERKT